MNKLKTSIALLFLVASTSISAQKLYVSAGIGYGLSTSKNEDLAKSRNIYNSTNNDNDITFVPIKLGQGFNPSINVGYQFSQHIAAELGLSYSLGSKTITHNYLVPATNYTESSIAAKALWIEPTMVIKLADKKLTPYAKIGCIVGSPSFYQNKTTYNDGDVIHMSYTINGGTAFGYKGSLGANYKLSEKIHLFGEVDFKKIAYTPTKCVLTKYTYNGTDELINLSVNDKEITYTNNITTGEINTASQPKKIAAFKTALGSVALNIGIAYHF